MPGTFRIFPDLGLVYVRYEGHILLAETSEMMAQYGRDPLARPGYKQLVDLSRVTGYETDFARLMRLQAEKLDLLLQDVPQTLLVYYAPDGPARDMARLIRRSWEGLSGVIVTVQETQAAALSVLGLPQTSFEDILSRQE